MADVREERGQLILVTGLVIAVTMVAIVLLLNTAIYTENMASRGVDRSGRAAIDFRTETLGSIGSLIDAENQAGYRSQLAVQSNVSAGIARLDALTAKNHAQYGAATAINETASPETGWLIRQSEPTRTFTNASGAGANWTLATGVSAVRAFRMTAHKGQLVTTSAANARQNHAFQVNVTGTGQWQAFVYENLTTQHIAVAVSAGGPPTQVCGIDASTARIDLSSGTINGTPCTGYAWANGVAGPYDLAFAGGDHANGTYELTTNGGTYSPTDLNDGPNAPSPSVVPAVYDVTVRLSYTSPTLTYRTAETIAPGGEP